MSAEANEGAGARIGPLDVEAIVFDMDGLLLDTESLALVALAEAGAEVGLVMPEALCRSMIGVAADASHRLLIEHHGADAPAERLFAVAMRRLEERIDAGELRVKPGVFEVIAAARCLSLPLAVATSSSRAKADHHLRAGGIGDAFDTVVTRDDVVRGKPAPDLYLQAAARIGIEPRRCLALEDSYNGVRAAHAAEMTVIMVPDLLPPTEEMARLCHAIAPDLHAVAAALADASR